MMVLQHISVGKSLLRHISYNNYFAQCQSRDFPTELCCNTIIHLLFHYFCGADVNISASRFRGGKHF